MNNRITILKNLLILGSALATTAVFGQTSPDTAVIIWSGPGTEIGYETNWGNTVNPNPIPTLTTLEWNGVQAGNLSLTYDFGSMQSGAGGNGYNIWLTGNQTGSVTIGEKSGTAIPLAISDIQIDSGAGAFYLGGPDSSHEMEWIGRPGGFDHTLINNSANTATIGPNLFFDAGAGAVFEMEFSGTGNWVVSNYLGNNNGPTITVQVDGPGTVTWNPSGFVDADGITSPITIQGGALILTAPHLLINTQTIADDSGAVFEFNAPGQSQTLAGAIIGGGQVQANAGTLTLAGANSFTGNLVLNGGTVIADAAETGGTGPLGEQNTIELNGGTLQFTSLDFADYSAVFSTAASQQYNFALNGQLPVFATGLTSSSGSLTLAGPGTLTLAGSNTYSGTTTVNSGTLVFQGAMTGTGAITLADGAGLGVTASATQVVPSTLTLGSVNGAVLDFFNVNSTSTPILVAGTLASAGTQTINIESGTLVYLQTYPLFSWTTGSAPAVSLGTLNGFLGGLSTNGNTIELTITGTGFTWTGLDNSDWDLSTTGNFLHNGISAVFSNNFPALFDDSATGTTSVILNSMVNPSAVTFNNTLSNYSLTSSPGNAIAGSTGLTKSDPGTVTLSGGANTYTGVTSVLRGVVSVSTLANGGQPSDIGAANNSAASLVLNGGDLQYTGSAASIDRLFTLGTSGGTIDGSGSDVLQLTNTGVIGLSGAGGRVLTLTGTTGVANLLAGVLGDKGGQTQVAVSGTGTWVLTGNSTNTGLVTVNPGATLQVGNGGASGSLAAPIKDNGTLNFTNTGTVNSAAISGTGHVNVNAGTVVLTANNTYNGGTTVNGTLQVGNGGATGALFDAATLVNNGLVIFDSTAGQTLVNTGVSGAGNWIFAKGFTEMSAYNDTFSGWWQINAGATFQPTYGNEAVPTITAITNNGTLFLTRQDGIPPITPAGGANPVVFNIPVNVVGTGKLVKENNNQNPGAIGLSGTNTYSGGTYIAGGGVVLGDDATFGGGQIVGPVIFTNTTTAFDNPRTLVFFRPDNFIFTNTISSVVTVSAGGNFGTVEQSGGGTVTLTANNTYRGGTIIDNASTLQVGNGGASGGIGTGAVTDNGTLVFDLAGNLTFTNGITGAGGLVQIGSGTLDLTGLNTYSGSTTVSNGVLELTNADGDMDVMGGTLATGPLGSLATMGVAGSMNISAGTAVASLNKLSSPSNTIYSVAGSVNYTGGTLQLFNFGPALQIGDTFTIFNQAVSGGTMAIDPLGFSVTNNLGVNGSVTVVGVSPPAQISATLSGGQLKLLWPASYTGLVLQAMTNALTGTWVTIPGTASSDSYSVAVTTNKAVFYRLAP